MAITFNQSKIIKGFNDYHKHRFNPDLFEKRDEELISAMADNIMSIQRDQNYIIRVMDINVFTDYNDIQNMLRLFINEGTLDINKDDLPQYDKIQLEESEFYLMIIRYYLEVRGKENKVKILDVPIFLPRIVNKYYFRLDNKYYKIMYQITAYSTYNNASKRIKENKNNRNNPTVTCITIFSPIVIDRKPCTLVTTDGQELPCFNYELRLFRKSLNHFKYTLSKLGLEEAMNFYGFKGYAIYDELLTVDNAYTFEVSNKKCKSGSIYIYVDKYIYDNDVVIQSCIYAIVTGILDCKKSFTYADIFTTEFWLMDIALYFSPKQPSIEKSLNIIKSLEATLDVRNFKKLRLPVSEKQTIYHIMRWIVREFDYLSVEDRLSLDKKRIQWAESIAALYSSRVTRKMHLSDTNIRLDDVENIVKVKPTFLLSELKRNFTLTPYRDLVNDLDGITALKYTLKDPQPVNYLETKKDKKKKKKPKSNKLPAEFRETNVSHLGRLDLDSSPKSDPGMSGILCPLTQVYGEYKSFTDFVEPNEYYDKMEKVYDEYIKDKNSMFLDSNIPLTHKELEKIYMDKSCLPPKKMRLFLNPDEVKKEEDEEEGE